MGETSVGCQKVCNRLKCCVAGTCTPSWTETANTHVLCGIVNNASTVAACQAACVRNTSCTGVDWNPSLPTGQMCWLSGHWSGQRQSADGITHYDIVWGDNCPGLYHFLPYLLDTSVLSNFIDVDCGTIFYRYTYSILVVLSNY